MRHRKKRIKLGKPADQRKALIRSLLIALISEERIKTSYTRAKQASGWADRLITLGKRGDIHSRREAYRLIQDRELIKKLFDDIAPRFKDVNGGYTRVIKLGNRKGDNALMALLEFTKIKEEVIEDKKRLRERRRERRLKQKQELPPVEEVKVEEEKPEPKKKSKQGLKIENASRKEKEGKKKEEGLPEQEESRKGFLEGLKGFLKRKREK